MVSIAERFPARPLSRTRLAEVNSSQQLRGQSSRRCRAPLPRAAANNLQSPGNKSPAADWHTRPTRCRNRNNPASGRRWLGNCRTPVHPPRPASTAPELRQACKVSGGSGSLLATRAAPPTGLLRDIELMVVGFGDCFQNPNRFVGNFRTDAVARQNREVKNHAGYCNAE